MTPYTTRLIAILLCIIFSVNLNAQEWMQQFAQLAQKKDDAGQQKLLKKWEKSNAQDPELYVAYLNYYYEKSKTEKASIQNYESKGKTELYKDSTKPNVHVYLNTTYDTVLIAKG